MDTGFQGGQISLQELDRVSSDKEYLVEGKHVDPFAVPYRSVFSLAKFLAEVEDFAKGKDTAKAFVAQEILRLVKLNPQLRNPIVDLEELTKHQEVLDLLRLLMTPAALDDEMLFKISRPFQLKAIQASPAMERLTQIEEANYSFGEQGPSMLATNVVMAGGMILRECYGVDIQMEPQVMLTVPDKVTGLARFYRPEMEERYVEVVVKGKKPKLEREDIELMLSQIYNVDLWTKMLPPDKFEFHGFMFGQLIDVTREESMSRLKHRLIRRDAVLNVERARDLADLVRIHFELPEIQLGLTAVEYPSNFQAGQRYKINFHLLMDSVPALLQAKGFEGSVYESALQFKEVRLVEDLEKLDNRGPLEEKLLQLGLRSLLLAPLINSDDKVIGLVELAAPRPYAINSFVELQFKEVISLFRTAVARSREEVDNRIEAVLREQYTSLHPSIEWRFRQQAFATWAAREEGRELMNEEISFKNVYPFFGQADIVGSTALRNRAVFDDLQEDLQEARKVLVLATQLFSFPLVDRVILEIDQCLAITLNSFNNNHESSISEFLQTEVAPLINQLGKEHKQLRKAAKHYKSLLDPELQIINRRRKDYELSLRRLNRELSSFFDRCDAVMQERLPHYFEKYKTDGVQYEIYAGQSLLQEQCFSEIHLRNLRLAQLIDLCGATRLVAEVSRELPMPLQTAQLIFAYTTPLDIRFRMDEKRFDVEGVSNIRYEILKKRIDKATIKGGTERLTLAGKIAIVYLNEKDREEYLGYLEYLRQRGDIQGEIEDLELDPLQSVQGLRALRFKVKEEN